MAIASNLFDTGFTVDANSWKQKWLKHMVQIFGEFIDFSTTAQEYLTVVFSPCLVSFQKRWHTNGMSADFIADYMSVFFPIEADERLLLEIKHSVSFISNELLENAVKFNDQRSQQPISLTLQLFSDRLVFLATNSVHPQAAEQFKNLIRELLSGDPAELYMQQLEKNAEDETGNASGVGLLTMLHDYHAKVGWKFETVQAAPLMISVSTMVQLII